MYGLLIISIFLLLGVVLKVFQKLTIGRCNSHVCLVGKTALVTGGNSGIGYQTAMGLAARGCRVIIADKDNCDKSKENIIKETGNSNIITKEFNLASLNSVRRLAKDINETEERLDILINNAGTIGLANKYTEDGLHIGMQVNHFGSFLLTHLLIDLLKQSAPSRIVFVSSVMAYIGSFTLTNDNLNFPKDVPANPVTEALVYSHSKLCNVITANILTKKLRGTGVTANSLHPGFVYTPLYQKFRNSKGSFPARVLTYLIYFVCNCFMLMYSKSPQEGAQTSLFLAMDKTVSNRSGQYFSDCIRFKLPHKARSEQFSLNIWSASEDYVKLLPQERI